MHLKKNWNGRTWSCDEETERPRPRVPIKALISAFSSSVNTAVVLDATCCCGEHLSSDGSRILRRKRSGGVGGVKVGCWRRNRRLGIAAASTVAICIGVFCWMRGAAAAATILLDFLWSWVNGTCGSHSLPSHHFRFRFYSVIFEEIKYSLIMKYWEKTEKKRFDVIIKILKEPLRSCHLNPNKSLYIIWNSSKIDINKSLLN